MVFEKDLGESKNVEFDDCLEWTGEGCTKVSKERRLRDGSDE